MSACLCDSLSETSLQTTTLMPSESTHVGLSVWLLVREVTEKYYSCLRIYPCLPVYVAPFQRGQCRLLNSCPHNYKLFYVHNSLNTYDYTHTGNALTIYTLYIFNNHTVFRLTGSWSWTRCSKGCVYCEIEQDSIPHFLAFKGQCV